MNQKTCLNLGCRLAGVALVVPVINYWWLSFPSELFSKNYKKQLARDQWKLGIAHYTPGLTYWWLTQKWFPSSSILERHPIIFSKQDVEIIQTISKIPMPDEVTSFSFILLKNKNWVPIIINPDVVMI